MKTSLLRTNQYVATLSASVFVAIAIAICPLASAEDGDGLTFELPKRVWTDTTGEYRLHAALVGYRNRELTLQKEDGSEIQVSVDKLCRADREFVASRLREARKNRQPRPKAEQESEPKPVVAETEQPIVVNKSIQAQQMYGIDWYNTDDSLVVAAANDEKNQKPIMWFRVLGDLSGFM